MAEHAGYTVSETLSHQQDADVYRARDDADGRAVLLKVLGPRHAPKDISRLKREHAIGRPLETAAIQRPIALATFDGMPALVSEDFGGVPLARLIGEPMDAGRFLGLATPIVAAAASLHREGLVHKDLKPENIYVHPATGEVKLAGLGLASQLPRELTGVQPPLLIEGSLPYLSPEQTGRTARAVDNRSDLYSLGVVFYQMLAGRFPFEAADALEWIYCHVARVPPSPLAFAPDLPPTLAALVEKLLAKTPEDRYQTARGLLHDLERCASALRRDGGIEPFALGGRDVADELRVPGRLYGREREIGALLGAFGRVISGGPAELFLVTGHPGVGKSALVAELRQPVLRERALFLSGKFDQYARNIPYSTLVQAFTRVILDVLAQDEEHHRAWREPLREALGLEARLIVDVIPPLRLLLGEPPQMVEAPLLDAELRFRRVFLEFLGVFARPEHPLVLFLDDLQWADTASLRLLEEILADAGTRHLLLVGAFRDSEVDALHPLALMLERVRKARMPVGQVALGPLGGEDLLALVSATVRADRARVRPLAAVVAAKTGGNPFFVHQFLGLLHQERQLWLEEGSLTWRWDIARIEARGYTDNVIDFMLERLAGLPAEAQDALKVAACVGNECEIPILALVYGKSEEDTVRDLREALEAGLILQARGRFAFAHDRVQQAAYALLEPAPRALMHLRIGRLLSGNTPPGLMQDRLFDIATQLDLGLEHVSEGAERLEIAGINLSAGRKARGASAYELAARYLAVGQDLLPPGAWESHYGLAYGIHLERARCEALSQRLESASRLIADMTLHARTSADQLEVAALRIDIAAVQSSVPGALVENVRLAAAACGKWLGVDLKLRPSEEDLRQYIEGTLQALGDRPIEDIARLPEMSDPAVKAGVDMLSKALPSAYNVDIRLHDLMSATIVRLSLRHGNCDGSPHGYSTFGGTLGRLFERWDEAYRFGRVAAEVTERKGPAPSPGRGSSYFTTGAFIDGWTRPLREVIPTMRRSFDASRECGDINVASFSSLLIVEYSFSAGETLSEVAAEAERQLEFTRHVRQYIQDYVAAMLRLLRRLRGQGGPAHGAEAEADAEPRAQHPFLLFQFQSFRAIEHFVFGDYRNAAAEADSYRMLAQMGSASDVAFAWYIAALAYACRHDEAEAGERAQLRLKLADLEEHHRVWEKRCAETFRNRRALISAEAARIDGRDGEAMRLYEEAMDAARADGFVHYEAMAAELAARFWRMRGLTTAADACLRRARDCYRRWGAEAKVDQLDRLHASLRPPEAPGPTATLAVRPEQLDLLSVLRGSQTISGEMELDKLARTLLETVLVQGGAQRAVLVFSRSGRLSAEAQAELEPGGIATSVPRRDLGEDSSLAPVSLLRYVELTRKRVILDDGSGGPVDDAYLVRTRPRSALCLPILRQGVVLGLLYLENRLLAGAFTPGRLAAVEVLAAQSAISVENAMLLAAERTARAAAEASEQRAALLSEVSARLSESLDYSAQLVWLSRFCVQSLADWCVIDILEGRQVVRAAGAHREAGKEQVLQALQRAYPPRPGSPHPATVVMRTREPLLLENIPDAELRRFCVDDEHARLIDALGTRSGVYVPLVARGEVFGAITLASATAGRFGRAELELAQGIARRAASTIDNARLYRASQEAMRLRKQVEAQLVQAQKMESIGRLAGGIAHDFNNLLTVITGGLELGRAEIDPGHPAQSVLADVAAASASAAGLTRQLLAFSRKQAIAPAILDVNEAVRRLEKVILRLLREDIRLETGYAQDLPPVCFDAGQFEQVVLNLAVNGRDAMPDGGRLSIRTAGVYLDEEYSRLHVDAQPGDYAQLEVSDTGVGMSEEVRARLFEPFFTTKASGKGTGLGLSVVYGAVRQNHGHIEVQSEPGKGTTFRIYLPAASGGVPAGSPCE